MKALVDLVFDCTARVTMLQEIWDRPHARHECRLLRQNTAMILATTKAQVSSRIVRPGVRGYDDLSRSMEKLTSMFCTLKNNSDVARKAEPLLHKVVQALGDFDDSSSSWIRGRIQSIADSAAALARQVAMSSNFDSIAQHDVVFCHQNMKHVLEILLGIELDFDATQLDEGAADPEEDADAPKEEDPDASEEEEPRREREGSCTPAGVWPADRVSEKNT